MEALTLQNTLPCGTPPLGEGPFCGVCGNCVNLSSILISVPQMHFFQFKFWHLPALISGFEGLGWALRSGDLAALYGFVQNAGNSSNRTKFMFYLIGAAHYNLVVLLRDFSCHFSGYFGVFILMC